MRGHGSIRRDAARGALDCDGRAQPVTRNAHRQNAAAIVRATAVTDTHGPSELAQIRGESMERVEWWEQRSPTAREPSAK
eukprot:6209881-Pleurochrysis_carterae.AAC.1